MVNYTKVAAFWKGCSDRVSPGKLILAAGVYITRSKSSYKTLTYTATVRYIFSCVGVIRMALTILLIRKKSPLMDPNY